MWDNPRLGIESMSSALAGGFLTPGPPGKSVCSFFNQMELETKWLTVDLRGSAGKDKCLMRFPSTWDESEGLWRASNRETEQEHQLLAVALGAYPTPIAPDFPQETKRSVYSRIVQSLSHVWLFVAPWTAARQASLSFTLSQSLLKLMSIESVMPSNHLILCRPLLLPSIFPSIRVFSNESAFCIRWRLELQFQHQSF